MNIIKEFEKAPQELKNAALKLNEAWKRSKLASEQHLLWKSESAQANALFANLKYDYDELLQRFNIEKNIIEPDQRIIVHDPKLF